MLGVPLSPGCCIAFDAVLYSSPSQVSNSKKFVRILSELIMKYICSNYHFVIFFSKSMQVSVERKSADCQCPPQQINHQPAHHNWKPPAWVLQLSGLYKVVVDKDYLGLTLKLKINKFHWYYTGIIKLVYISNTRYAIAWHFNYFCIKYLSQLNSVLTWVGSDLIMSKNPPHLPAHMKL